MLANREVGVRVVFDLKDGRKIEGWLKGRLPEGYLVALDRGGEEVRLVPDYQSAHYDSSDRASFAIPDADEIDRRLRELDKKMGPRIGRALNRMHYRSLRRFSERASRVERDVYAARHDFYRDGRRLFQERDLSPTARLAGYLMAKADETVELHADVFREIEASDLVETISEFAGQLAALPPDHALPRADSQWMSKPGDDDQSELRAKPWTAQRHRELLQEAQTVRTRLIGEAAVALSADTERAGGAEAKEREEHTFLGWCGASLRILAGTGLCVGNAALGLTAGLGSTIASIAATAVPTYVGVATSIYTGLTQTAEGLEKIAALGKSKA